MFTAWSFGGYKIWALHLLLIGGVGSLLASILPMPKSWDSDNGKHGNLKNLKRLLNLPFFWVGSFFLTYILIQYINPSLVQVVGEKSWWVGKSSGTNFPSSVKSDYESMNALRAFVIHASAISLTCGILVGIQNKKTALIILWSFLISGSSMGIIAVFQKLSGSDKLLWLVEVSNLSPWGTFAYRNQASAYLILVLIIAAMLYFFYDKYFLNPSHKLKPKVSLVVIIIFLLGSIWLSLSRGGIILSLFLFLIFSLFALINISWGSLRYNWRKLSLIFLACGSALYFFVSNLSDWEEIDKRWNHFQRIH